MHSRTLLAAIAVAAITAIGTPTVSYAQDPPKPDSMKQDPQRKESKGEVATAPSFGSLISAINSSAAHNDKLKAATTLTAENVQLVDVSTLLQGNNVEALNEALSKNEADVTALRTTIGANTTINSLLTANATPLTGADVVATDVGADGKVIVYYWKKQQ